MVARQRRGEQDWWIGGVTDAARRTVAVDLSFLPKGKRYSAEIWRDGPGGGIEGTASRSSAGPARSLAGKLYQW